MRGLNKAFCLFYSPHPNPLGNCSCIALLPASMQACRHPAGEGAFFLNLMAVSLLRQCLRGSRLAFAAVKPDPVFLLYWRVEGYVGSVRTHHRLGLFVQNAGQNQILAGSNQIGDLLRHVN
jgi:hypothetical protein